MTGAVARLLLAALALAALLLWRWHRWMFPPVRIIDCYAPLPITPELDESWEER